ncbi:MAG: YkgJ family cysteine cluster protein [Candidatus Bathyarchaeia archaeon]|nr:YkgJ family cysteine cluster protein [Candidatus Bathyarchaeota archaeon]
MNSHYRKLTVGDTANFECLRCGRCCSSGPNVGLTAFDILRIAEHLGVEWQKLRGRHIIAVIADTIAIPILMDKGGGRCVFLEVLNGTPHCSIYPARPMKCKIYPFILYSSGNKDTLYLDECCPGVKVEKTIEPPWKILEKYIFELRVHYSTLYKLVFDYGIEPIEALERTIDEIAETYDFDERVKRSNNFSKG